MALSTADFWKLCIDSRLLSPAECHERDAGYRRATAQQNNSDLNDAAKLAKWLISEKVLTTYQAKVLLSGRPGPFVYGEYRVDDLVTTGRQAGLFRATHLATGHRVALWPLTGPAANDSTRLLLVRQKVEIARRAAHPLLCACYELVESATGRFIVLEDLSGQSLEEHLAARGSLPLADACRVAQLSALALSCLHEQGQAHGDVRPANIWLGKLGDVKVLQVPLSRDPLAPPGPVNPSAPGAAEALSAAADYSAPELIQGGRPPHPPSDVYALGCTLYQALAGRPPFVGDDWRQKAARHALEPVEPLARLGVPAPLSKFVNEMLAKDPAARPQVLQVAKTLLRHAGAAAPCQVPEPPTLNAFERMLIQRRAPSPGPATPPPVPKRPQPDPPPVAYPVPMSARPTPKTAKQKARARANQQYLMLGGTILFFFTALTVALLAFTGKLGPPQIVEAPRPKPILRPAPPPGAEAAPEDGNALIVADHQPDIRAALAPAPRRVTVAQTPSVLLTGVEERDDDGQSLWASPTAGPPISLRYVAAGAQSFLAIRPAELLEHSEGEKTLAAIGPAAGWARQQIETIAGVPCSAIEQLVVALYDTDAQPSVSLVVRLRQPIPKTELKRAWKETQAMTHRGQAYYAGSTWAYYLPHGEDEKVLVIADPVRMKEIIEADGAKPLVTPRLEWLLDYTDGQRTFTAAILPNALLPGHGQMTAGVPATVLEKCRSLLGDGTTAALFSLHLGPELFAELRLRGSTDDPTSLTNAIHNRLAALSGDIQTQAAAVAPTDPTNQPARSLQQMMQAVFDYSRWGAEDDQAVGRCCLPAAAAPHLAALTQMALSQRTPAEMVRTQSGGSPSVAEALVKKIDLSFPRDTLESALQLLSREIGVPIEILGGDLQLEGITKNQSFGLDERQRPAGEILRKILWQSNPDGKLVYVIKPKAPGGPPMLWITTRSAAKKRGDAIPSELEQNVK